MPRRLQIADHLADVGDGQGIDAGEGLVQQHEGRLAGQRPGDLHPPPLAAGERDRRRGAQVVDVQLLQQLGGDGAHLVAAAARASPPRP